MSNLPNLSRVTPQKTRTAALDIPSLSDGLPKELWRGLLRPKLVEKAVLAADVIFIVAAGLFSNLGYQWLASGDFAHAAAFVGLGIIVAVNFAAIMSARQNYHLKDLSRFAKQAQFHRHLVQCLCRTRRGRVYDENEQRFFAWLDNPVLCQRAGDASLLPYSRCKLDFPGSGKWIIRPKNCHRHCGEGSERFIAFADGASAVRLLPGEHLRGVKGRDCVDWHNNITEFKAYRCDSGRQRPADRGHLPSVRLAASARDRRNSGCARCDPCLSSSGSR